uniref:ATP-dependent RNA helicase n=1 Tax=Sparus aurata TaxID=8175 RepID=A0A671VGZ0_SPAAU
MSGFSLLVEALEHLDITHPTTVQLQTIPKVMKGHNILCAAETGSGKTLSYLLPVVHRLQAEKDSEMYGEGAHKISTLVLVPSRELAEQVAAVSRTLCAPFGFLTRTIQPFDPTVIQTSTGIILYSHRRRLCLYHL